MLGSADSFSVFDSLLNPVLGVEGTERQKDKDRGNSVGTSLEDFHVVLFRKDVQQFKVLSSGGVILLSLALLDVLDYLNYGFSQVGILRVAKDVDSSIREGGDE